MSNDSVPFPVKNRDFGWVFWVHVALIVAAYSAPWWFPWWLVVTGVAIYYWQSSIFFGGECLLTKLELRDVTSFWHYYLSKIPGYGLSEKQTLIIIDGVMPGLIALLAATLQLTGLATAIF